MDNTTSNQDQINLKVKGIITNCSMKDFGNLFSELVKVGSDQKAMILTDLNFNANQDVKLSDIKDFEEIIKYQIPILDWLLALVLKSHDYIDDDFEFKQSSSRELLNYNKSDYISAITGAYFLLMTRNKIILDDNEVFPKFMMKFLGFYLNKDSYISLLTENEPNKLINDWILTIDVSKIGVALTNRLKAGIAGTRALNVFSKYQWRSDISESESKICNDLRFLAINGPYWEIHPIVDEIASLSFSKNIMNVILNVYDGKTINKMVESKVLFKYPVKEETSENWRLWDFDLKSKFKNKIFK